MSSFKEDLRQSVESGSDLWALAEQWEGRIEAEEARAVVDVLASIQDVAPFIGEEESGMPRLVQLSYMLGAAADAEASGILCSDGAREVLRLYDAAVSQGIALPPDLLSVLNVLMRLGYDEAFERVVDAATIFPESYVWSHIMEAIAADDSERARSILSALSHPLPPGFAGIAYLDMVNQLARAGLVEGHPFDTDEGAAMLEAWIDDPNPDTFSYAVSAAASFPFLCPELFERLEPLAANHPNPEVRLEAAFGVAARGGEAGFEALVDGCLELPTSQKARLYLEELGKADLIPAKSTDPDFEAMAEMVTWLMHPQEFGRAPDSIELRDTREMHWPPTNDTRRVWLFDYEYEADERVKDYRGVGMVGSITFSLTDETNPDALPEDNYALHCCWELEANGDERTPEVRTVEGGRRLLGL